MFTAMDTYGLTNKQKVKEWYDRFIFGKQYAIYTPWSIIKFLATKEVATQLAETSSNALVSDLLAHACASVKKEIKNL